LQSTLEYFPWTSFKQFLNDSDRLYRLHFHIIIVVVLGGGYGASAVSSAIVVVIYSKI
jgi:acetoin utilization deacetylase AcuC-like enzyme